MEFGFGFGFGFDSHHQAVIAMAEFTFADATGQLVLADEGAFDGLVFGGVDASGQPPLPPVPEPAAALLLLSAGLGFGARRLWRQFRCPRDPRRPGAWPPGRLSAVSVPR